MYIRLCDVEFECKYCGKTEIRLITLGRPLPQACPKREKTKSGKRKNHLWTVIGKYPC